MLTHVEGYARREFAQSLSLLNPADQPTMTVHSGNFATSPHMNSQHNRGGRTCQLLHLCVILKPKPDCETYMQEYRSSHPRTPKPEREKLFCIHYVNE